MPADRGAPVTAMGPGDASGASSRPRVGVLALQGAFREHRAALERSGAAVREVRLPAHLEGLAGLVVPGGESTTMAKLMQAYGLDAAIRAFYDAGGAVWGTCAGAIAVANEIVGHPDQPRLDLIDIAVRRNAYGRQVASFEAPLTIRAFDAPFPGIFIRAPRIERTGPDVEILGAFDEHPVMVRSGRVFATVFHPELADDDRVHAWWLAQLPSA